MDRDKLIKQIMTADFVLHETALFLDTHPENKKALEYYKLAQKRREELAEQHRKSYGPLTYYEVRYDSWNWVDTPWPWQNGKEA